MIDALRGRRREACPNCGAAISAEDSFCPECGTDLRARHETPDATSATRGAAGTAAVGSTGPDRGAMLVVAAAVVGALVLLTGAGLFAGVGPAAGLFGAGTADEAGGPSGGQNAGPPVPEDSPQETPEETTVQEQTSVSEETNVGQTAGEQEPTVTTGPGDDPAEREAALVPAIEDYYEAVDRQDWGYTYQELDTQTAALFDEEEWYQKNQYLAPGADMTSLEVEVLELSPEDAPTLADVAVYRGFDGGTPERRDTVFVWEDGRWQHRFVGEELDLFEPGVPYSEFTASAEAGS